MQSITKSVSSQEPVGSAEFLVPAWPVCRVGTFVNPRTGQEVPARCKSWYCVECGPRRVRRWQRRLSSRRWGYLITLTVAGPLAGAATKENIYAINRSWRTFSRWLKRNAGLGHYAWTNEQGETSGRLHKHVIVESSRIDYKAARAAITRAGLGQVCDFAKINSQRGAMRYITKYLAKHLDNGCPWPKFARRAQTALPEEKSGEVWLFNRLEVRHRNISWRVDARMGDAVERMNRALEYRLRLDREQGELALTPKKKKCVTGDGDAVRLREEIRDGP